MAFALLDSATATVLGTPATDITVTLSGAPDPGNLLIATCVQSADDELTPLARTGWTALPHLIEPGEGSLDLLYRVAEAGDPAAMLFTQGGFKSRVTVTRWSGSWGSDPFDASAVSGSGVANPITVDVTPTAGVEALIIGHVLHGTGPPGNFAPITGTEIDDGGVTGNFDPTQWLAYRVIPLTSGAYNISADFSNPGFAGWTIRAASFIESDPDPEPGIWMAWDGLPFNDFTTSDPDAPLARMMPQAAAAGVSDNVTDRVLAINWNRGGSYDHIGQDGPGGATIVLRNDDGLFDPDNAAGALYGKLVPGIPVWAGCIRDTGAWSGTGTVRGVFGGYVKTWSPTVDGQGQRVVEVICEDALGHYRDIPVTVSPSLTRSHGELREAILTAAGESVDRLALESEPGMLPVSAVDSQSALSVLEELNQATASRHFVQPADTKEEWYFYTVVNKYHGLADAVAETINGDDITDVSGWVVTNENRIEQQRAEVQPVSLTPNNNVVWTGEVPITVRVGLGGHKVIWASFDDYVFDATLDYNLSSGTISPLFTNFGKTAKIDIWATSLVAVIGKLRVLGRQVVRGDTVGVVAGDTSAGTRGGSTITTDLIGPVAAAQGLVDFIVWKFSNRLKRPSFTVASKSTATMNTIADRDLYDVIGMVVDSLSVTSRRLEIIGLSGSAVPGRFHTVTYQTQETPNQSALHWFTVGTDTVGSAVPIAPF